MSLLPIRVFRTLPDHFQQSFGKKREKGGGGEGAAMRHD